MLQRVKELKSLGIYLGAGKKKLLCMKIEENINGYLAGIMQKAIL